MVNPDQTAPREQSDLGLPCLLVQTCPNTSNFSGGRNIISLFYPWHTDLLISKPIMPCTIAIRRDLRLLAVLLTSIGNNLSGQ